VCDQVAGRVPVLVGVTDTSFVESVNLADYAADAGAAAVVLSAPYYFPAGQAELIQYVEHITAELPLPLVLYNMPSHTKVAFEPETVRRLIDNPRILGLKDSSSDMIYFHRIRRMSRDRPDWTLMVGPEELLADAVLLGGDGGVCGGANLYPRLLVDLYEAARTGDTEQIERLDARLLQFRETIYAVGNSAARVIKGLKCALSCLGICNDFMAEPFRRFRTPQRRKIQEHLERLQITPDTNARPAR
jgi:4-hydroxy-tetrahydrodipicolinate synthase